MPMRFSLLAIFLCTAAGASGAAPVLVVHPTNPTRAITREEARKLLLGEQLAWASGEPAEVIQVRGDDPAVADGYLALTRKTLGQVRAAWNRLVFSGQAEPPFRAASQAEAVSTVARRQWSIAIVDSSVVDGSVKVLLRLAPEGR
jgi:hypothetical protein